MKLEKYATSYCPIGSLRLVRSPIFGSTSSYSLFTDGSLTRTQSGLVRNHFEAWSHGPVVGVVYHSFKRFGEGRISTLAEHLDYATGKTLPISFNDITHEEQHFIRTIAESYERYSTGQLVEMLHAPGGPWQRTMEAFQSTRNGNPIIPEVLIREHFAAFIGDNARH